MIITAADKPSNIIKTWSRMVSAGMFVVLIRPLDVGGWSQSECDMKNIKPAWHASYSSFPQGVAKQPTGRCIADLTTTKKWSLKNIIILVSMILVIIKSTKPQRFSRMTAPSVTSAQQVTRRWDLWGSEAGTDFLQLVEKSPSKKIGCWECSTGQLIWPCFY